ncbi:MAG: amino acid adenylation domain-containing protein, partial [Streptococcaceae bacterium]|nr:amino acid adenylation domain-containing protein [Streptococcaceae bacterium]
MTKKKSDVKIEKIYSLTPLQEGILYHYLNNDDSREYVLQTVINVFGKINNLAMQKSLHYLEKRHATLRTSIVYEKLSKPRQIILAEKPIEFQCINLTSVNSIEQKKEFEFILMKDVERGFNLTKDSLMRLTQVEIDDDSSKLILSCHHIITDGWCLPLVFGDLFKYYNWILEEKSNTEIIFEMESDMKKGGNYSDYVQWLEQQDQKKGLSYWNELLEEYDEVARIQSITIPGKTNKQVNKLKISLDKKDSQRLVQIAKKNQVTINTIAESVWGVVLQRYNNSNDVVFGKVVSGRNADVKGIEEIVGIFINTIPVRVKINEDATAQDLWKDLQRQSNEGNSYHYCSLAEIQMGTRQGSDLIQTLFVFQNYHIDSGRLNEGIKDLSFQVESSREQTNYDISIVAEYNEEKIQAEVYYNPGKYSENEMHMLLQRIKQVFVQFSKDEKIKIKDLELTIKEEKEKILYEFNDTTREYAKEKTVIELFEEQVKRTPDKIALVYKGAKLSYKELNEKSNQIARVLRGNGVGRDTLVGIISERSLEMIVGIYGIIKAGGAYVPIDPGYPSERIKYIIDDCKPKVILCYETNVDTEIDIINLQNIEVYENESKANLPLINKPKDLIYVIYTSGTTGRPKGVMIEHKGVVCLSNYLGNIYNITDEDNVLQFANYVFDASVWEMTMALHHGATLSIIEFGKTHDANALVKYCNEERISIVTLPPNFFVTVECLDVRIIVTAGSESSRDVLEKAENSRYINAYGPTENTVAATHWERVDNQAIPNTIPIGKPISNTKVYILDEDQLCGIGMPGELCIAGDKVARGYLNQDELSNEKFINNPYGEGRLYRSGDLARWLEDGNIEYLGRIDDQVKIRGFRIELGEIESILRKQPGVQDVAVIASIDKFSDKILCGYIVSEEEIDISLIKENMLKQLPEYMIPSYITQIEKIPLTI